MANASRGIDQGETPVQALFRELKEEIGCDKATLIAESQNWYTYELPNILRSDLKKNQFHSIKQKWFLMSFIGNDEEINIANHYQPEFSEWKWVSIDQLKDLIIFLRKKCMKRLFKSLKYTFNTAILNLVFLMSVQIYTTKTCLYCVRAKALLEKEYKLSRN